MTNDEMNALLTELKDVSRVLREFVSRVVEQQGEFKALLTILDQKGLVTSLELDRASMELDQLVTGMVNPPVSAKPSRLGRCRRNAARARDWY